MRGAVKGSSAHVRFLHSSVYKSLCPRAATQQTPLVWFSVKEEGRDPWELMRGDEGIQPASLEPNLYDQGLKPNNCSYDLYRNAAASKYRGWVVSVSAPRSKVRGFDTYCQRNFFTFVSRRPWSLKYTSEHRRRMSSRWPSG